MNVARRVALEWWTAREVKQTFPDDQATQLFLAWMERHRLGRKRLLDTQLAATYRQAGITSLLNHQCERLRDLWRIHLPCT